MGCNSSCFIDPYYTTLNGFYGGTRRQIEEYRKRKAVCRQMNSSANSSDYSGSGKCYHHRMLADFSSDSIDEAPQPPTAQNSSDSSDDLPYNAFSKLNIGDNIGDKAFIQHQDNYSHGYYSESNGSGESNPSYACVRTQDTSCLKQEMEQESPESGMYSRSPSPTPLEMEMYMMYRSPGLMPKTSSPIMQRRNTTFSTIGFATPSSQTYQKWSNFLQTTPAYMLNTVSDIPEALAGNFSPLDFPGFTDLECMDSPAKRFKADVCMNHDNLLDEAIYENQPAKAMNVTHTVTTDL